MRRFLETVVWCSEKAAGLARACRKEKDLFQLLVEVRTIYDIICTHSNVNMNLFQTDKAIKNIFRKKLGIKKMLRTPKISKH